MKNQLAKLLKETGIELAEDEITSFSLAYEKLIQAKGKLTKKNEKSKFNKILKLFSELEFDTDKTLFPNIIPDAHFGIPSIFTDNYSKIIDCIDDNQSIIEKRYRRLHDQDGNQVFVDTDQKIGFIINDQIQEEVEDPEDIFDIIKANVKNAAILQTYCALWNYAIKQKSFRFNYVPADNVLEIYRKKPQNGYFRQSTRIIFTNYIKALENMFIRIPVKNKDKGKKKQTSGYIDVPLVDFRLSVFNKKRNVILKLVGELLGCSKAGNFRGRVFPEGIFDLDSRKESARIILAFRLATRFDQLNHQPIKWTRKRLVEQAGLTNTDKKNRNEASKLLKDTLNRLQSTKCIKFFTPDKITTKDDQEIIIYSPSDFINLQ